MKINLLVCEHHCKCYYCERYIKKGEKYIHGSKRGWNASTYSNFNVCAKCILRAYTQIEKPRLLLKEILAEEIMRTK